MKLDWKMTLWCSSIGLLISPLAHAQFCSLTNASLIGTYGYTASEAGAVSSSGSSGSSATSTGSATGTGSTATTTGTNTGTSGAISLTSNGYSNTELGQLLSGIGSGNQFTAAGAFTFDGDGNINAIASPANSSLAHVGTYNVNSDCSVTISLTDAFGTNTTATQLGGIILGHGSEIDLRPVTSLESQSGTGTSTGATTSTGTSSTGTNSGSTSSANTPEAGLTIKLVRVLYQNGCSDSNLSGLYGFVLNPSSSPNRRNQT